MAVCATCGATNPATYKYCVTCGGNTKGTGTPPGQPGLGSTVPMQQPVSAQAPAQNGGGIMVAPVLNIADAPQAAEATTRCARCHGLSAASSRYCKYCGADLAGQVTTFSRPAATPTPAPASPAPAAAPVYAPPPAPAPAPTPAYAAAPSGPVFAGAAAAPTPPSQTPPPAPSRPRPPPPKASPSQPGMAAVRPTPPSAPGLAAAAPLAGATSGTTTFVGSSMLQEMEPVLGRLVVLVEDGSEGKSFDLHGPQMDIGRVEGDIILADDPYVSPRHARLVWADGQWVVRDLGSTNGVYARVQGATALDSGDLILLGLQVLQFQAVSEAERSSAAHRGAVQHGTRLFGSRPVDRLARLDQRTIEGVSGDVYYVFREETFIGREVGDIVFTHDPFLSRRHAVVRLVKGGGEKGAPAKFTLEDLGSSNGTYLGIRRDTPLASGDRIRIGQHLFRLDVETGGGTASPTSKALGAGGRSADPKRGS